MLKKLKRNYWEQLIIDALKSDKVRLDKITSDNKQAREARMIELLNIIKDPTESDENIARATLELIRLEEK